MALLILMINAAIFLEEHFIRKLKFTDEMFVN